MLCVKFCLLKNASDMIVPSQFSAVLMQYRLGEAASAFESAGYTWSPIVYAILGSSFYLPHESQLLSSALSPRLICRDDRSICREDRSARRVAADAGLR
jgi:hypothetical protein